MTEKERVALEAIAKMMRADRMVDPKERETVARIFQKLSQEVFHV